MTARLEILGDDGEWHNVLGVRSVELVQEPPDDDALAFIMPPFTQTVEVTITPRIGRLREAFAEAEEAMQRVATRRPRVIDQDGNPVRAAWQSPYGPQQRRH